MQIGVSRSVVIGLATFFNLLFGASSWSVTHTKVTLGRSSYLKKGERMTLDNAEVDTEERSIDQAQVARWDPDQQIYVDGIVPDASGKSEEIEALRQTNGGHMRIFGYGSLCWNPGSGATLSKESEGVTRSLGRAKGWRRCWAQRSAGT